jgi:hypothetical protein
MHSACAAARPGLKDPLHERRSLVANLHKAFLHDLAKEYFSSWLDTWRPATSLKLPEASKSGNKECRSMFSSRGGQALFSMICLWEECTEESFGNKKIMPMHLHTTLDHNNTQMPCKHVQVSVSRHSDLYAWACAYGCQAPSWTPEELLLWLVAQPGQSQL